MGGSADAFDWTNSGSGADVTVRITHHGRPATVLRGDRATAFLAEIARLDDQGGQDLLARLTGNYRRGNERTARDHPRNRGR